MHPQISAFVYRRGEGPHDIRAAVLLKDGAGHHEPGARPNLPGRLLGRAYAPANRKGDVQLPGHSTNHFLGYGSLGAAAGLQVETPQGWGLRAVVGES